MREVRRLRGKKGVLALVATVALVAGLIPVGAFAFVADEAGDTPEFLTVDDTAAATFDAPETGVSDDQALNLNSDKTDQIEPAQLQDVQQGAGNAELDSEIQGQEGQTGEQAHTAIAASEEGSADAQRPEGENPDAGDGQLHAQGVVVSDGLGAPTITVTAPAAGATSATAPVVTAENGAGYSVANAKWCDADGRPLADPVTFEAGQTYYLSAQLNPTATSGTKSYFRTSNVTCNGGEVVRMFNSSRMMNGRIVFASLEPVISVKATGAAEFVDLCVGANSNNGDVQFSYTYIGRTATGTISGSTEMGCGNGSILTLTAVPKENYEFVGWFSANYTTSGEVLTPSGDAIANSPTITLTIAPLLDQTAYCAVFAEAAPVEVALSGTISTFGTTTVNGTAVNTAAGEKAYVAVGEPVTIVITPKPGYMVATPKVPVDQPSDFSYQQNADHSAMTITFTQPEGGVRVEAWIAERIAVSYDVNGGTKGSAWPENDLYKYVAHGTYTRFTAPAALDPSFATPPEGMEYAGYQIGSETVAPGENSSFGIVTSPLSIKLLWEPGESQPVVCGLYISLDGPNGSATIEYTDHRTGLLNSFTLHGHSLQAVRVVYGTDVTVTAVPDEGYSLVGWFEDPDDKNTLVSTDTTYTYTATEPTILMAEFEHVHTWGAWAVTTEPTCTEPGEETRICSICGEEETREVAALGHEWDEGKVTAEPTCTGEGVRTFTCTRCGETKTETIAALGHDWGEWAVTTEPTCTDAGVETRTCKHDASHTETREVAALGHDWGEWKVVKEATETADGEEARTCSRCGEKETRVIPHLVVEYRNTAGDGATWTKGSGTALAFTFNRNINDGVTFTHFAGILVDGAAVGDSNYSAVEGSVVVTLNAGYLEGLSVGDHTIAALFDDGNSATAGFAVKAAEGSAAGNGGSGGVKPANATRTSGSTARNGLPGTGDPMRALPGLLAAMALCGAVMFVAASRMRSTRSRGKHARR